MKFTNKQILERENLEWFNPSLKRFCPNKEPTEAEFREYFDFSERGIPIKSKFNYYVEAKRHRGITIHELWEDSFYAQDGGWVGLNSLLRGEDGSPIPEHIAKYITREIFAGQDREKIMGLYYKILQKPKENKKNHKEKKNDQRRYC